MRAVFVSIASAILLSACGGGGGSNSPTSGSSTPSSPPPNQAPILSLINQTVVEGQSVTIDANASDPDGNIAQYAWEQVSGDAIEFSVNADNGITLVAPQVSQTDNYRFQLTAQDNDGASSNGQVTLTVVYNQPPTISPAEFEITLDGQIRISVAATDNDGGISSYNWEQLTGPEGGVLTADGNTLLYTPPSLAAEADLSFQVNVTDGYGKSSASTIDLVLPADENVFTLAGKVSPVLSSSQLVEITVGSKTFATQTNDEGDFRIDISLSNNANNQIVRITSKGSDNNSHIKLAATIGAVAELEQWAGKC